MNYNVALTRYLHLDIAPTYYMERYKNKPEFEEEFFTIKL
jgi:hypothetical protein